MDVASPPTLEAPEEWDRYYQANVDLELVVGTPGIESGAIGEEFVAADAQFTQASERGFFLLAPEPVRRDPVELCASISGAPDSGFLASITGARKGPARQSATGTHTEVEQLVRGARVIGSAMRVHEGDRGIFAVTGRPIGELAARDPGPPPAINEGDALQTCTERFELDHSPRDARVEQVVFPTEDGATWAYEVGFVVPEHSADVRTYLAADDLSVLLSYNISSAATRKADVYRVNPTQTPNLESVSLEGLEEPGSILRGNALDVTPGAGGRIDRPDGSFVANPADDEFDEPQAYFLLWTVREYFSRLVEAPLLDEHPFAPLAAIVRDPKSPSNAYYRPTRGDLSFGLFGDRSSARSASIVCHEFGHAVTDAICKLGRSQARNTEARGLSEGFSDYFAASLLDDPRLGVYVAGKPDGSRNCSDPALRFPAGFVGKEHDTGAVWAAVLWGIRAAVGQETADKLAIESVNFLGATSTFEEARTALVQADDILFAQANQNVIDEKFDERR
jgi:hypothetical protein